MKRKIFGTDGVRGKANLPPITAEVALRLGLQVGVIGGALLEGTRLHEQLGMAPALQLLQKARQLPARPRESARVFGKQQRA